ncbi:MAG TPA: glycosyltransferase [Ohtaekwangia sp.]|nr:glycosyltransferase [Ohtaekwangia sp.]
MDKPLVTIICLCYNHERFVREAIASVINQTYQHIEIIVVDDASTDNSVSVITSIVSEFPHIQFLPLGENLGNCKAFNKGLALANGKFIIDLSTDDVLHLERVALQVDYFSKYDSSYGVLFTDAVYIDEAGNFMRHHFEYLIAKKLIHKIPQGDVFADLLSTYFVASPTMMVRREVFDQLQGYDESLAYEDFDFWVRSSRHFKYVYLDKALTYIRKSKKSLSTTWYVPGDTQLYSTYLVCLKALSLIRSERERFALILRIRYEIRQSVLSENHWDADLFYALLKQLEKPSRMYTTLSLLNKMRLPLSGIRQIYHRLRFR